MSDTLLQLLATYGAPLLALTTFASCLALPVPSSLMMLAAGAFVASGDLSASSPAAPNAAASMPAPVPTFLATAAMGCFSRAGFFLRSDPTQIWRQALLGSAGHASHFGPPQAKPSGSRFM